MIKVTRHCAQEVAGPEVSVKNPRRHYTKRRRQRQSQTAESGAVRCEVNTGSQPSETHQSRCGLS